LHRFAFALARVFPSAAIVLVGALHADIACAAAAATKELPANVRDMLREAHPAERKTVINIAKRLYPDSTEEVDRIVKQIDEEKKAQVTRADFIEGIRGEVTAGGYVSTGNTNEWDVAASASLRRQARLWVHGLDLRLDLREEEGNRTEERLFANYTLRRNFVGSKWFAAGGIRYERDRFQGFARRFGEFVGPGYQIANNDALKWEIMGGPGVRQTRFIDAPDENQFGLFARTVLTWNLSDTLQFKEDASAGAGKGNDTYASITSLTTDIYGDFSLRASFTAELETKPPPGRERFETYSRISIVYTFEP
jgi:putative salt-induced outer membrane protein